MPNLAAIIEQLPRYREEATRLRECLLANLALIGEVPAPTFGEWERASVVAERFADAGLQDCAVDGTNSALAVVPGATGKDNLLLVTNVDTLVEDTRDQTIEIQTDRLVGPFVGDNSIALAALVTLPALLERLGLRLNANLVLLAAARCLGRGNLEGVRAFLGGGMRFQAGLCLESLQLGRLNYTSIGMLRGEIVCRLPDDFNWSQYGATGTITPMSEVISRIRRIALPQRPLSNIVLGAIHGGIAHNNIARETTLSFEVRSESSEILAQVREQFDDITEDVSAQSGTRITLDVFAVRQPGGLDIAHPLVRQARAILAALRLAPSLYPTTSLMAAVRDVGVPAITVGCSVGERKQELDEIDEAVGIAPLATGLAQLVGLLQAADGGFAP